MSKSISYYKEKDENDRQFDEYRQRSKLKQKKRQNSFRHKYHQRRL